MVGYELSSEDKKLLKKLKRKFQNNITHTAREFCKQKELEYTDSSRRKVSAFFTKRKSVKDEELTPQEESEYLLAKGRILKKSKIYLFTWEQNKTPLHNGLWKNLLAYKEFHNAELSVILGRYKNPTSHFVDKEYESWNKETLPYRDANRHNIHKYVTVLSDVKIQPTAEKPLTGLEGITGETTTIIGSPKLHLKTIPVLEGHPKKILLTTGAITIPNYIDSKAGKKGEFTHKLGFTIVEIKDDETFYIRQVEADENGDFIDLFYEVKGGKVNSNTNAEAIVWGDTHIGALDKSLIPPTEEIMEKLSILVEVHHDLVDGSSVNNHILKNPIEQYFRMQNDKDDINKEISEVVDFVAQRNTCKIIVQSNHNDRFDRWIINQDWKKDIKNALPYLKYTTAVLEGSAKKGVIAYVLENNFTPKEVLCLDYDDSYMIGGFEVAHHGHLGTNGSRGSIEQFGKMSTKMIIGHSHSPNRINDVLSVGTSTHLREGFNKGASSWMNSHVIIHKNGTAQHILFINGGYTTFTS